MNAVTRAQWRRLLLGFVAVHAPFPWSARSLGGERGEAGLLVAALVAGTLPRQNLV